MVYNIDADEQEKIGNFRTNINSKTHDEAEILCLREIAVGVMILAATIAKRLK